jgi:hypothetical protein
MTLHAQKNDTWDHVSVIQNIYITSNVSVKNLCR